MNVCVLCLSGVEDVSHNYTRLPSVLMHSLELLFHLFGIHWVMPGLVKDRSEIWYDAYFFSSRKGVLLGSVTLLVLWSFWLEINCTLHNMFILADDIATNAWISLLFFSWATSNSLQGFWFLIFGPVTWMVILCCCSYLSLLTFFYFYSLVV